jgi:hypothetical protein
MRTLLVAIGLLALSLGPIYAGENEYRIEYVDAYACPSRDIVEELDKYLTILDQMLFVVKWAGRAVPTMHARVQGFNDKLDPDKPTCPRFQQHVLIRTVDIYQPSSLAEGYPALVVEMRLPNPDVEEHEWPTYYGLKTNEKYDCGRTTLTTADGSYTNRGNPNCGTEGL